MSNLKCIAYLDILGFSNYVMENDNAGYALGLLYEVAHILQTKMIDQKNHPPESYDEQLQPLALRGAVTSFEYFLPMSDSIFISSNDANLFIEQLSKFLAECFMMHVSSYLNSDDPMHPEIVREREYDIATKSVKDVKSKWYPLLFRGGVSFGEVVPDKSVAITDKEYNSMPNLLGKGVVSAVKLEQSGGKGPKLFIDDGFYNLLNGLNKALVATQPDGCKHFLWPAYNYIFENPIDFEYGDFMEFSQAAINLWKAYRGQPYAVHYFEFMKLSIESFIKLVDIKYPDDKLRIRERVKDFIRKQDIDLYALDLEALL